MNCVFYCGISWWDIVYKVGPLLCTTPRYRFVSWDCSCSLTALTGADACCFPVGQGFQYSIVDLVYNVHAPILLSHHQPGEAQLSAFNDLNSSQSDCDTPVESYPPRATTLHHHATVLIQEPDVVASRCYFSPPEVVPLLAVAFCPPLEERRRPPGNASKYPSFASPDSRPTQRPALRNGFGKAAGALLRARILSAAQLRRPPHSRH